MTPDKKAILAHLNFLFSNVPDEYKDGRIEIAYTGAKIKSLNQANYFGINEIDAAADFIVQKNSIDGINIYVGAALRKPDCPPFGRSSLDDYYAATAIWVDIDDKEAAENAKPIYNALPPAFVVVTGRYPHKRFQAWWRLDTPHKDHNELKFALSGLQCALNGDPSVVDAARVMRVGGTVAWPKKEGRVTEATEIFTLNYNVVSLENIKAAYPPTLTQDLYGNETRYYDDKPRNIITGALEIQKLLEASKEDGKWHFSMRDAIASMVGKGWSDEAIRTTTNLYRRDRSLREDLITPLIYSARKKYNKYEYPVATETIDPDTGEIKDQITAKDISELDLDNIPPRAWLFGTMAARKYVTMIGASPGAGKSIFTMQVGVAASSGKPFGVHTPQEDNIKTWIYNNEEGEEELRRRLKGILMHFELNPQNLSGNFFMNSGENRSICIARRDMEGGGVIHTPDFDALKNEVLKRSVDMLIVDPFAETHDLSENSNDEIKRVSGMYRKIAIECNCAVILVHHTRKGGSNDSQSSEHNGNMDNMRGAGSQLGVVRRVFTLAKMDEKAAKEFGISPELRRWYVRLDDAKTNITAPAESAEWFKFKSINIGNGSGFHLEGDSVGVLVHKDAKEISEEESRYTTEDAVLLLTRLARIFIKKSITEGSIRRCAEFLIEDGYGKYKDRMLRKILPEYVNKMSKNSPIIAEGYQCFFDVIEGKSSKEGNTICFHIKEISDF